MKIFNLFSTTILVFNSMLVSSCGGKGGSSDSAPPVGPIESAFNKASVESGAPVRMLMAIGYLESRLHADQQSALYIGDSSTPNQATLTQGDSAFGIPLDGLSVAGTRGLASSNLVGQIDAYGKFLKNHGFEANMPANAITAEEKMRWIFQFASIHRGNDPKFRKLWSVFALEMIDILNEGFVFQDPDSKESITLAKESTPLTVEQMPRNFQQDLSLYPIPSEIRLARFLDLNNAPDPSTAPNIPSRVEVIHCPFSLSACLKMQTTLTEKGSGIGAHYIIPNTPNNDLGILQVAKHNESVFAINSKGITERVTDRVIVMLVGQSGSYVGGIRKIANPLWLTDSQLNLLKIAVPQICNRLQQNYNVNASACSTPGSSDTNLKFKSSQTASFQWGDIPDYEETIFWPYFSSPGDIYGTTSMQLDGGDRIIAAGSSYNISLQFQASAKRVTVERLVRCSNENKVVWETVDSKPVKGVTNKTYELSWDDAGPNSNGEQFYRAKVTGDNNRFLGWSSLRVQLSNFDRENAALSQGSECY